jgi:Flp pilus assembly pilin Flp
MLVAMDRKSMGDRPSWIKTAISLLRKCLDRLSGDRSGQDDVEYAVFIGAIALVVALSLPAVAGRVTKIIGNTQTVLKGAENCGNPNPGTFQGRSPCAP